MQRPPTDKFGSKPQAFVTNGNHIYLPTSNKSNTSLLNVSFGQTSYSKRSSITLRSHCCSFDSSFLCFATALINDALGFDLKVE